MQQLIKNVIGRGNPQQKERLERAHGHDGFLTNRGRAAAHREAPPRIRHSGRPNLRICWELFCQVARPRRRPGVCRRDWREKRTAATSSNAAVRLSWIRPGRTAEQGRGRQRQAASHGRDEDLVD